MAVANTPAYYDTATIMAVMCLMVQPPGVNAIKLFLPVTNEFSYKARVFARLGWKSLPGTNTLALYENS